jgi:hypothetical protein
MVVLFPTMPTFPFLLCLAIICGLAWGEAFKPSTEDVRTEFLRLVQGNKQRRLGGLRKCESDCDADDDASET